MEESRYYLAKIYESLRLQQEMLFDLTTRVQALEYLLSSIPGYEDRHPAAIEEAVTSERVQAHAALLAGFAFEIAQLRGENPTVADA